jgi:TRAP-type C4-dicarboxylate transport system permease small subunit
MTMGIGLVCIALCLVLAWYGFGITFKDFANAEKDVRSLDMPRWMIVMWIPTAFFLMAVEFARFLWRRENFLAPMTDIA